MTILSNYSIIISNNRKGKRGINDMLAELRMKIEPDNPDFGYYQSSNMHGVLMEQLDSAYADQLHEQGLKPYSQYLAIGEQKEWIIKTFTKEAYQNIISPLFSEKFVECTLMKKQIHIKICSKELRTIPHQELLDEFYSDYCSRYIHLEFLTPTAFKSFGKYIIIPDTRYIFQSLMNKYSASSTDMEMYDAETLEQLVSNSEITQYKLRSVHFPLEGIKIPSFKGELTIKINGTITMAKYARLLARFGEYSGVGIKTAIGMGGLRLKEWRQKND